MVLIATGGVLLLAALALAGYNLWDDARAARAARNALAAMGSTSDGADYAPDPNREMPTVEVDGYRYIGKVAVPSLDLELPVLEQWDYRRLRIAPCRYSGTAYLPGFVICAHNYSRHFGRIKNLAAGDEVIFTDCDGAEFRYTVVEIDTLGRTDVEKMLSPDWDLTLFTCTLSGRTRVTVRCRRAG